MKAKALAGVDVAAGVLDPLHTCASWRVRRGTPLPVLNEPGDWETLEMMRRYVHLLADHLLRWVQPYTQVVNRQMAAG